MFRPSHGVTNRPVSLPGAVLGDRCQASTLAPRHDPEPTGRREGCLGGELSAVGAGVGLAPPPSGLIQQPVRPRS